MDISLQEYYQRTYFDTDGLIELPGDKYICNMSFENNEFYVDLLFNKKKYRFRIFHYTNEEEMMCSINGQIKQISKEAKHVIYVIFQQYLEYNKNNQWEIKNA